MTQQTTYFRDPKESPQAAINYPLFISPTIDYEGINGKPFKAGVIYRARLLPPAPGDEFVTQFSRGRLIRTGEKKKPENMPKRYQLWQMGAKSSSVEVCINIVKPTKIVDLKEENGAGDEGTPALVAKLKSQTPGHDSVSEATTLKKGQTVTVNGDTQFKKYVGKSGTVTKLLPGKAEVDLFDGPRVIFRRDSLNIDDDLTEAEGEASKPPLAKHLIVVVVKNPQAEDAEKRNEPLWKKIKVPALNTGEAIDKAKQHYTDAGFQVISAEEYSVEQTPVAEARQLRILQIITNCSNKHILKEFALAHPIKNSDAIAAIRENFHRFMSLTESLSPSDPISKWIGDFTNSKDSRFSGKSKEERISMAKGAYYAAQKK